MNAAAHNSHPSGTQTIRKDCHLPWKKQQTTQLWLIVAAKLYIGGIVFVHGSILILGHNFISDVAYPYYCYSYVALKSGTKLSITVFTSYRRSMGALNMCMYCA